MVPFTVSKIAFLFGIQFSSERSSSTCATLFMPTITTATASLSSTNLSAACAAVSPGLLGALLHLVGQGRELGEVRPRQAGSDVRDQPAPKPISETLSP